MMKPNRLSRWLCICLICAVNMLSMSIKVIAQGWVDQKQPVTMTIQMNVEGVPVPDVNFRIYRVASLASDGSYVLTEIFGIYPVSLIGDDLSALCQTLAGYVVKDGIPAEKTVITDNTGAAAPEGGLPPGLYLVMGDDFTLDNKTCLVEPALIELPGRDDGGSFLYDVEIYPKWESLGQNDSLTVLKIWEDAGYEEKRPADVQAKLVDADTGQVWGEAALGSENNWRHTWDDLPQGHSWYVVEHEVPRGYTVTAVRDGSTVVLKNTYEKEPEAPAVPGKTSASENSDTSGNAMTMPKETILPQTGTLKWLVPVLAVCGMALFLTGWFYRRRNEEN